jgi:glycosyltransferase involved in cell wall biosynthesis
MIAAVMMVKDEADIIEAQVRHLFAEGIDRLIVADNLSSDGTGEILAELAAELPVTVQVDDEVGYWQSQKMTALAHQAGSVGADWVVPVDADEVWWSPQGSLADVLRSTTAAVCAAEAFEHVPQPDDPPGPFAAPWRRSTPQPNRSVAFRYQPSAGIAQGNHSVWGVDGARDDNLLRISEFQYRSFDHFVRKVRNGKAAYDATTLHPLEGAHWRRLGALSDDELAAEWERMTRPDGLVFDPAPVTCRR